MRLVTFQADEESTLRTRNWHSATRFSRSKLHDMSSHSRRSFLSAGTGVAAGFAARPAAAQTPLDRLQKAQRILLKGGIVLSLDSQVGDFEKADILIEGQKIAAIAPNIPASSAVVVDATGMIVMPGFVDTHHHQYETLMRSILSDGNLGIYGDAPKNYISVIQGVLTPAYLPDDAYISELVASLSQTQRRRDHHRRPFPGFTHSCTLRRLHRGPQGIRAPCSVFVLDRRQGHAVSTGRHAYQGAILLLE